MSLRGPTIPDEVRDNELAVTIQSHPGPGVSGLVLHARRDVLRLRVDEGPDLVALDPSACQVDEVLVHVDGASLAKVQEELRHRVLGHPGHAHGSTDRVALYQGTDDLRPLLGG